MQALTLSLFMLAFACGATAQTFKTVIAQPSQTNYLDIPLGQSARVVNLAPWGHNYGTDGEVVARMTGVEWAVWKGDVWQGPVRFQVGGESSSGALITVELLDDLTPPDRTLILPHGTNAVSVSLEVSTNLTHWATATNGVYVTGETPRFFRIKAVK